MQEQKNSIVNTIIETVRKAPIGTLFFSNSFSSYDDEYVGHIMSDLVKNGELYRVGRGVYLKSVKTKFGLVYPTLEELANAVAERDHAEILPTGATALNILGLSTQVPMNPTFITTGSARVINLSGQTITFKRAVPRNFAIKGKMSSLIVQALKAIGEKNMTESDYENFVVIIKKYSEIETLESDMKYMPIWIRRIFQKSIKSLSV